MPSPDPSEFTQPASQALQAVELAARWHIDAAQLLAPFGLTEAELERPDARLPVPVFRAILSRLRELTGEPGIGFYLGLQRRISRYGYVGFAAMNAATLREVVELFIRYTPVITNSISLRLHEHDSLASLIVEEHTEIGDVRDIVHFSFLVGMQQIVRTLTGRDVPLGRHVDVPFPEPSYFPRFSHLLANVRFSQPQLQIVFDSAGLDARLTAPDRAASRLAREECERALTALGFESSFSERTRRSIAHASRFRSLEEVANELGASPRTLKRKLAADGVSFSQLQDSERKAQAMLLLRSRDATLESIAERLGYSSMTNFSRAFRRWTGTTPAAYRRDKK